MCRRDLSIKALEILKHEHRAQSVMSNPETAQNEVNHPAVSPVPEEPPLGI